MMYSNLFILFLERLEARLDQLGHKYLEGGNGLYQCTVCMKTGKNRDAMKMHLESKHFPTDGAYECDFCDMVFNTKNSWKAHKNIAHRAPTF